MFSYKSRTIKGLTGLVLLKSSINNPIFAQTLSIPYGNTVTGVGVDYLNLDLLPTANATICAKVNGGSKEASQSLLSDSFMIKVDTSQSRQATVAFIVSDMVSSDEDYMMFLVYSTRTSPSPQLLTRGTKKLQIDLATNEILGVYSIPAQRLQAQTNTRVGLANPAPTSKVTVYVNLESSKLDEMLRIGNTKLYIQAALLAKSKFQAGNFEDMILSEMDTIELVANNCPSTTTTIAATSTGTLSKSSSSTTTISTSGGKSSN